jgi:hypothetical protein
MTPDWLVGAYLHADIELARYRRHRAARARPVAPVEQAVTPPAEPNIFIAKTCNPQRADVFELRWGAIFMGRSNDEQCEYRKPSAPKP